MSGGDMEYREFEEKLLKELKRMNPENEVTMSPVLRNNGVIQDAVLILPEGKRCTPNIYLRPIYDLFLKCRMSLREAAFYVMQLHGKMLEKADGACVLEEMVTDFEKIRSHLTVRMVSQKMNQELLKEVVNFPFLDLAAVLYVADDLKSMNSSFRVTPDLMSLWGIRKETLIETALENLKNMGGFRLREICEVIGETGSLLMDDCSFQKPYLYVLIDQSMRNGPAALLLPDVLEDSAEKVGGDLLILPSSVSELIVLEAQDEDYQRLRQVVREINGSIVDREEILGDHVYKYSRDQSRVTIAA